MDVLFATDTSRDALRAQHLVSSITWPQGTRIEALTVGPAVDGELDTRGGRYDALYERIREGIDLDLSDARRELTQPGRDVATTLLFGRPASAIIDEACRVHAQLIVVGSRGRGPIATTLLGSVSAEVVDHAPCPVLVARTSVLRRVLLAADGSAGARDAEEVVASWPFLAGLPVVVVSVAAIASVGVLLDPLGTGAFDAETYQAMVEELRGRHDLIARQASERLRSRGVDARPMTYDGSPVEAIVNAATDAEADLIVTGTRGRTGLARLALGSVARGILTHAPVSVLTVRHGVSGGDAGA